MEHTESQPLENDEPKDIFVDQVVNNMDEAYTLYQAHAFKVGFSVRKGQQQFYDNARKNIRLKEFYCSKRGFKNNELQDEVAYERADSRTGCQAMVRFNVSKEGLWKITKLVVNHNHDFALPYQRHLLRSMRNISTAKGGVIKSLVNAGMSVTNAWSYIGEEVGGFDKAGSTMKDMQNFVYTEKVKSIEAGDAQSLANQLQKRQSEDPMFYYTVQLDQESRLTNVFWRDGKSKLDYDCFGDVVVFDTTYRTNRFNLICAPFVGVNHHWQNVMFGCALLADETAISFIWLFKVFLESMGNQQPKTIFTDQDASMAKAIREVMPNTCHRLCLWHIAKNAPSHLGALNLDHKFQSLLQKCMSGCDSEEEFESTWKVMMNKHHDHKWLGDMYKIRHKWSTAYSKEVFSAGIKSSQRSESTNSVLAEIAGKTTSLTQFFTTFQKMVKKWRQIEVEKDFKSSQSAPPLIINSSYTLRHASTIYTHKIFKLFLKEYLDGTGGSTSVEIGGSDNLSYHEVIFNQMPNKKHIVTFDSSTSMVNCSCHKFEFMGILCSHALRIYNIKGILTIPVHYFLKRWSKNARSTIYEHVNGDLEKDDDASLLYRNAIMKSFYNLVLESQEHKETQQIMWDLLDVGVKRVQQCLGKLNLNPNAVANDKSSTQNEDNGQVPVVNPLPAKTKGMSGARKKGHFEKRKRSTTKANKNKEKRKEGEFCASGSYMDGPSNVAKGMDEPSNVAYASFDPLLQVAHPSSILSLDASTMQSSTMSLYRPIMPQMAPPLMPQFAPPLMPFSSPQILQPTLGMQPVRPIPIRPPVMRQKTTSEGGSGNHVEY